MVICAPVSELENAALSLSLHPRSSFLGIPVPDLLAMLERHARPLNSVPTRDHLAALAKEQSIPPEATRGPTGYEGLHLVKEGDEFKHVYIALEGAIVRYSILAEPDYFWVAKKRKADFSLSGPWDMPEGLVTLAYLVSNTRLFDMTHECEMVGTTELLTARPTWQTCVYQARRASTLQLDIDFLDSLSDQNRARFHSNAARVSITTWAYRCRRQQELLARYASGQAPGKKEQHEMARSNDRLEFARELILEHLDAVARRMEVYKAPCYAAKQRRLTLHGSQNRLAYFLGIRPPSLRTAFQELRESGVVTSVGSAKYVVNLDKLRQELGSSKFALQLELTDAMKDDATLGEPR
jgi:CRP-like cAMP-binding protein